jgi:predicted  nucleic acid-binding Zn-ribbon protein
MLNLCRGGNGKPGHRAIAFDGESCPWCQDKEQTAEKISDLEAEVSTLEDQLKFVASELKDVRADLTALNMKMAPDYEGIIESRKEMKEGQQKVRDDHPELILDK